MEADTQTLADEPEITSDELDSIAESSDPFVGNWQKVISRTNWEKGQIIFQWRSRLAECGVSPKLYSDPAWSRLVGEVSPQHVGRLRRTWERFGEVCDDYAGLYWSHFFAALDWNDAEMWLEGAVQNQWSVSKMRYQRWETMGKLKSEMPRPGDGVITSDEDGAGLATAAPESSGSPGETAYKEDASSIQGPLREGPDFGDESDGGNTAPPGNSLASSGERVDMQAILDELPAGIAAPFRQLREAIAEARADDWRSAKRIHLVALVNDLRQLLRNEPKTETTPE